jgi:D-3-phosphoglycerate dehydrogenase
VALSRNLFDLSWKVHKGNWQKSAAGSHEVRGKTIRHRWLRPHRITSQYFGRGFWFEGDLSRYCKETSLGNSEQVGSLEELLEQSDFVTLHVPETPETKKMMGAKQIKAMKKGAYLINASRGSVVDLEALKEALNSDELAGAAVDVYPSEPKKNSEGFETSLQNVKNVILTPHIGGSTQEAQFKIGQEVSESLDQFFTMGHTVGAVLSPISKRRKRFVDADFSTFIKMFLEFWVTSTALFQRLVSTFTLSCFPPMKRLVLC